MEIAKTLPKQVLITIYKAFMSPCFENSFTILDKACNESFHEKRKSIQSSAV